MKNEANKKLENERNTTLKRGKLAGDEKMDLEGGHLIEGTGKEKFPLAQMWQQLEEPMVLFNQLSGEDSVCCMLPENLLVVLATAESRW